MRIYFEYNGVDKKPTNIYPDYIKIRIGNEEKIYYITGELDYDYEQKVHFEGDKKVVEGGTFYGRFKGEFDPPIEENDVATEILNMEDKYFYFGLFEEDEEPPFTSLKIMISVADVEREFTILGEKK